jgi:arylsulfatase A-like enzyme
MSQPNILWIYSDQHRYDCVAANGHPLVQTPNLDRLAREGANFSHAFTPIPICVPARCSLLTGQFAPQHGVILNFDGDTFRPLDPSLPMSPRLVQQAGYHTIHVGRWHVDPHRTPLEFGFHDYLPDWRYGKWRSARGIPPAPRDAGWRGQTDPHATPEQSSLAWAADRVIRKIDEATEGGDPFFLRWQMAEPHLPCRPPEPFASMYDPQRIDPWPGFGDELDGKPYIQRQQLVNWDVEGLTWDDWAPIVARYLGVVSLLDQQIGRVLDALDARGLADNTLVIYTADHGDMCGSHGMVDKHYVMYDDVVRVPLLMRWPGVIPAGRAVDAFVSNVVDAARTFVDVAGGQAPDTFEGVNLVSLATGESTGDRQDIYASYHGNQFGSYSQRMLRDRRWKYVWNATAPDELYDLQTDPGEKTNLAARTEHAETLARLRTRLADWMQRLDDSLWNPPTQRQLLGGAKLP